MPWELSEDWNARPIRRPRMQQHTAFPPPDTYRTIFTRECSAIDFSCKDTEFL